VAVQEMQEMRVMQAELAPVETVGPVVLPAE
jgi:hypothetical protein